MESEVLRPWPALASDIHERFSVESLKDEEDGLIILLSSTKDGKLRLRVRFQDVVAYRCIDESYRFQTWSRLGKKNLPSLAIVTNSHWIHWLNKESGMVLEELDVTHYVIFTHDDCIDIVTKSVPEVTRL